jgi:hypothetical protein
LEYGYKSPVTDLPWDKFIVLPGDPRRNWEILTREVIRRHYERYGSLLTRKQQPGVEFHLRLTRPGSDLGDSDRHWGWQCRWYEPDDFWSKERRLRADQRRAIEAAIEQSARHLPDLTDWVLWTREKLSGEDARWFQGLEASFELHHWDQETLVGLLTGPAEILRKTWFGQLVLDEGTLIANRLQALAPIRRRYMEELHIRTPSQDAVDALLPGPVQRDEVSSLERRVAASLEEVRDTPEGTGDKSPVGRLVGRLVACAEMLAELGEALRSGDLTTVGQLAANCAAILEEEEEPPEGLDKRLDDGPFRAGSQTLKAVGSWLEQLHRDLASSMLAVVGSAGAGKTHLAANLTGSEGEARGVLVLGRQFGAEISDDDLARHIGLSQRSDELLEALEALGAREGRRVPLVIDGLNESRDPRSWQVALNRLRARLQGLHHVVVIVTLRPGYRDFVLPDDLPTVELAGMESVEREAIGRYFDYYKIRASPEAMHWWPASDALMLSIFCQTVNREREEEITAERLPGSLHEVFEHYLEGVFRRVSIAMKVEAAPIALAANELAHRYFTEGERALERGLAAEILGDALWQEWDRALRFHLEGEGLLVRDMIENREVVLWSYDLLAGHLIARSLLERHPVRTELVSPGITRKLRGHPLMEDVIAGLSGLLASEGTQLTELLEGDRELYAEAAIASARLAADEVGPADVRAMIEVFQERPRAVLKAMSPIMLRRDHPLNARILDSMLKEMDVSERDLAWTEWVREQRGVVRSQVRELGDRWRDGYEVEDQNPALIWLSWVLTTSGKGLHDEVTHALYRLGRRAPEALFVRTLEMLDVNDPTVSAGLLAASYGVVMASQEKDVSDCLPLLDFAGELERRLLVPEATSPTTHWLLREYAYRTCQFAAWLSGNPGGVGPETVQPPLPQPARALERPEHEGAVRSMVGRIVRQDFPDDLLASLFGDDGRDDAADEEVEGLRAEIAARVNQLVWAENQFQHVDLEISSYNTAYLDDPERVEPYGNKYGWIGLYEAVGRLSDRAGLTWATEDGGRLADMPIDPSFPPHAQAWSFELGPWVRREGGEEEWVRAGKIEVPDRLLCRPRTNASGDWIAVDAFIQHRPPESRRRVVSFIRGVLALEGWEGVERFVGEHGVDDDLLPPNPVDRRCFAGEAPWAPTFDFGQTDADGSTRPRTVNLQSHGVAGPRVELLAVDFAWGGKRSALNEAKLGSLPAKHFARLSGLRKRADEVAFVDGEGEGAVSVRLEEEDGWSGRVLYARKDLIERYCAVRGGEWGWISWGERQLLGESRQGEAPPNWLQVTQRQGKHRFSRIIGLKELCRGSRGCHTPRSPLGSEGSR